MPHMIQGNTNDPKGTWKLAGFARVERRAAEGERRKDTTRKQERRAGWKRALKSLLRM
jgi:hypothetical protein